MPCSSVWQVWNGAVGKIIAFMKRALCSLHFYIALQSLPSVTTLCFFFLPFKCTFSALFSSHADHSSLTQPLLQSATHTKIFSRLYHDTQNQDIGTSQQRKPLSQHGRRTATRKASQVSDQSHCKFILEYTDCLDMTSPTLSTSLPAKNPLRSASPSITAS